MTRYYIRPPDEGLKGGKIKNPFKQSNKAISKGVKKGVKEGIKYSKKGIEEGTKYGKIGLDEGLKYGKIGYEASKPYLEKAGKIAEKKVLPGVVTVGLPVASAALGALTTYATGNPALGMLASQATQTAGKAAIPKKYQSNNPYINMAGEFAGALASSQFANMDGMEGLDEIDPYSSALIQTMGNYQQPSVNYGKKRGNEYSTPTKQYYNPDNPYQDIILQQYNNHPKKLSVIEKTIKPKLSLKREIQQIPEIQPEPEPEPVVDYNKLNDALYGKAKADETMDSMVIKESPYQQKEGNASSLLGAGIKKKRGRLPDGSGRRQRQPPKKVIIEEETEIYIKKKPSHKKFSGSKNASLDQLIEATKEREEKEAKKAMKLMVEKQTSALKALGYGLHRRRNRS